MGKEIIIRGRKVYPGVAEGEALVSKIPLMGWGNYNVQMGYTVARGHPLYEVPIKDKILVFPYARGSGGFVMYGHSTAHGNGPKAMLFTQPYSVEIKHRDDLEKALHDRFLPRPRRGDRNGRYRYCKRRRRVM